jgi:uncharacterized protein
MTMSTSMNSASSPRALLLRLALAFALGLVMTGACRAQLFYSVVSPDGRQSWLLGTLHSEDARLLNFPPVLEQALRQADTVALELVPGHEAMDRLASAMQLPEGHELADYLDDDLYERVIAALRDHGMQPEAIARLRPWAAALTLAQPPVTTGRFMDLVLAQRATAHGAVALGLETMAEQLAFFSGMEKNAHIALLESAVDDHEQDGEAFEALVQAWLAADLDKLVELAEAQLSDLPARVRHHFRHAGIVERNRNMAQRAQPLIERGGAMIAVGALHLPGPEGMVALLREQGNRVEAIY